MPNLTPEHKQAMAEGRHQQNAVTNYLQMLKNNSKRGPKRTEEDVLANLASTQEDLDSGNLNVTDELQARQRLLDLEEELEEIRNAVDADTVVSQFVEVAAAYSERKGISYKAWREQGVPASTLREAGITRY